ncbi:MAG: formate--phosphoribosylaminoimidazolecarboxamide ligase [Desulfurococcus sp.]|uniref:formate--phosphoribosylaminoimidazolecarboxamide ligase n=1 Tax=Desulfurococcus sp. TaxID=51678 RepID=UPI00315EEFD4
MNTDELLKGYDTGNLTIGTLASHSALQIMHGAKKEGFTTILVALRDRAWFYREFDHLIDLIIEVDSWRDVCKPEIVEELRSYNTILVPHGSFVEYVGLECGESIKVPLFGTRSLLRVEADQKLKMLLLMKAGIPTPRVYGLSDDIREPVIVKLPGAKGGKGYFIASSNSEVEAKLRKYIEDGVLRNPGEAIIQEYLVGVTAYFHYFYSPVLNRLELLGADIRYESDVDGLRRLPVRILGKLGVDPTFTVVGNLPLVLRESLLPRIIEYGKRFVDASRGMASPGVIGPFCLESVIDRELNIKVFEFSGRIVAGTNLYIDGSPYSYLYWDQPVSMGRRIAIEVRLALENGLLEKIVT